MPKHLAQCQHARLGAVCTTTCLFGVIQGRPDLVRCRPSRSGHPWGRRRCTARRRCRGSRPAWPQKRSAICVCEPALGGADDADSLDSRGRQPRSGGTECIYCCRESMCGADSSSAYRSLRAHKALVRSRRSRWHSLCSSQSCRFARRTDISGRAWKAAAPGLSCAHASTLVAVGDHLHALASRGTRRPLTRLRAPFTSTTQMRHAPMALISFK